MQMYEIYRRKLVLVYLFSVYIQISLYPYVLYYKEVKIEILWIMSPSRIEG